MSFKPFFRLYRQTLYHAFYPPRWKTYFPALSLISLGIGLLILEYLFFRKVFGYLLRQDLPIFLVQFLLERLVGLIFLISYSMIFMSSMINGLSCFFLSANLPFLFTLPVPKWRVLVLKFLENWFVSSYLVLSFLLCFLLAYAHTFRITWASLLSGILLLIVFAVSPVALGSSIVVLLIRFFPVRRIHQFVTFLGGIFLAALLVAVRMMQPERLLNPADTDDYIRIMRDLTIPSLSHLPSSWSSQIFIYGGVEQLALLSLFTVSALLLFSAIVARFYEKAFVFSQETRSLRGKPVARRQSQIIKSSWRGLMTKDLKLFLRDATQWSQLLLLLALIIVYLVNIRNLAIQLSMIRVLVSFINLGLAGFVLAALSVRFLFPSVSNEGRAIWVVKTLPISFRKLLWCKYLIYFPPLFVFTQLLVYFSNRILEVPWFFMMISMLNIFCVSFALTGLAIGIGALMPNFKADHPSRIAVGPGGVLYMLLSVVYIAVMLILQARPVWYYMMESSEMIQNSYYIIGAIALTLGVGLIPMEWGARRLSRKEIQ